MDILLETIDSALAAGVNPVAVLREATGYSLERIAIASGLALADLTAIEAGASVDGETLTRMAAALGSTESITS